MVDNEGHKLVPGGLVPGGARSFVPKRPIRAAIIVFVVLSVLATIFAIATGNTRWRFIRFIGLGIACSAFLAFVSVGTALAARRLRRVVLWCAAGLCLVSAVLCGVFRAILSPRLHL